MNQVNIFQAKTDLSKLIVSLENHEEDEIIIARGGTPVAVLKAYIPAASQREIGKYNGKFIIPGDIDESNDEILQMFGDDNEYFD